MMYSIWVEFPPEENDISLLFRFLKEVSHKIGQVQKKNSRMSTPRTVCIGYLSQ